MPWSLIEILSGWSDLLLRCIINHRGVMPPFSHRESDALIDQDDERISAWWYPEPRNRFDTPGEGAAVLMAPGIEAVKETAGRVPVSRLQRIGSQSVSSATRAGERDRLWPELWSTTSKKSTRWCWLSSTWEHSGMGRWSGPGKASIGTPWTGSTRKGSSTIPRGRPGP